MILSSNTHRQLPSQRSGRCSRPPPVLQTVSRLPGIEAPPDCMRSRSCVRSLLCIICRVAARMLPVVSSAPAAEEGQRLRCHNEAMFPSCKPTSSDCHVALQEVAPAQDDTADSAEWAGAAAAGAPAATDDADPGGSAVTAQAKSPHTAASSGASGADPRPATGISATEVSGAADASMADAIPAEDSAAPSTRLIAGTAC